MKKIFFLMLFLFSFSLAKKFDLTVVGFGLYTEALGRLSITTIQMLKNFLHINYVPADNAFSHHHISQEILKIMSADNNSYGNISLMYQFDNIILEKCKSKIKLFYTMFDSSALPNNSQNFINKNFDALIVPDDWLVDVYKKAGALIPIFVLPCPISLKNFFTKKRKKQKYKPFVFGSSGSFVPRKNHITVLNAFINEFGRNPNVQLILHGRWGSEDKVLKNKIKQYKVNNVKIINSTLTEQEYLDYMASLDCYVFLSKGEGYSITPREALALGIPCILSNNTAHQTLCKSKYLISVKSEIKEPSTYCNECGFFFSCRVEDAQKAMKEAYTNYNYHFKLSQRAKQWVMKYDYTNLCKYYLSLVKPKKIIFGNRNIVDVDFLMTDSRDLYQKYKELGF